MTRAAPGSPLVWLLVVTLGVGTFLLRLSFIQLYAWVDDLPPSVERAIGYVPVALFAALIFPALFSLDEPLVGGVLPLRALAGGVAAVVAWRTGDVMATIVVGMGVLWTLQFVVG